MRSIFKVFILVFLNLAVFVHAQEQTTEELYLTKSDVKAPFLFDHFQYNVSGRGAFVLSGDKKSFYSNEPFTQHQIKQIDINTGKVIALNGIEAGDNFTSALSPWGEYLIAGFRYGRGDEAVFNIILYKTVDRKFKQVVARSITNHAITKVFIKDSGHILAIDSKGAVFELDKKLTIQSQYQLEDIDDSNLTGIDSACYDDQKQIIYYATKSHRIKTFDLIQNKVTSTSKPLIVAESKYDHIFHLRLDESRTKLIGGFNDELGVYNLETQKLRIIGNNYGHVNALAVSPDFKTIITTGISGGLKVWDYKTGVLKKELQVQSYGLKESFHNAIDTVEFIDNDKFLYASSLQEVRMAQLSNNKMIRDYSDKTEHPRVKKISDDQLAIISTQGTIYYFNLNTGRFTRVDELPLENVKRVISDGNKRMLISQRDGHFILLNAKSRHYKDFGLSLRDHFTASFALHPTLNMFARASSNDTLQIFNIETKKEVKRFQNELFNDPNILAFLDDNIILYSGDASGFKEDGDLASLNEIKPFLQFVDIRNKKIYHKKGHIDEVNNFDITHDKKFLLTASADRTIKLWKLNLKHPKRIKISAVDTAYGEMDEVSKVYFSDNEDKVLSFGRNGSIVIREVDLNNGKFGKTHILKGKLADKGKQKRRTWDEHLNNLFVLDTSYYGGVFYDNDNKFIAVDDNDNINFIDTDTGEILYRIVLFGLRDWLKIYPDGTYLSSKNGYKYITRFDDKGAVLPEDIDITHQDVLQDNENYEKEMQEALKAIRKQRYEEILSTDFSKRSLDELHRLKKELYGYNAYTKDPIRVMSLFKEMKKRGVKEDDDEYIQRFKAFLYLDTQKDRLNKLLVKKYNLETNYHFSFWDYSRDYSSDNKNTTPDKPSFLKITDSNKDTEIILSLKKIKSIKAVDSQIQIHTKDGVLKYKINFTKEDAAIIASQLNKMIVIIYYIDIKLDEFRTHSDR